jgi:hypothetical protein
MSHFSVLLIHENDEDSIMEKRNCDADADTGANIEFQVEMTFKEAKAEYKKAIGEGGISEKENYPDLDSYMEAQHSHLNKGEGGYGYNSNNDGMYDWYTIGGRWSGILPTCDNEKELKKLVKKALDLKNPKVKEQFRDKVDEYVKLGEMSTQDAAAYLCLGGQNEMRISDDISVEAIIGRWKLMTTNWNSGFEISDVVSSMIGNIIIEEDGDETVYFEGHEDINEKFFIEKYNYFLKLNKEEDRNFQITILDLHI